MERIKEEFGKKHDSAFMRKGTKYRTFRVQVEAKQESIRSIEDRRINKSILAKIS